MYNIFFRFTLLLQCWHTNAEERPSFRKCLNLLLTIKTDVRRCSISSYANQQLLLLNKEQSEAGAALTTEPKSVGSNKWNLRVQFDDLKKPNTSTERAEVDKAQLIEYEKLQRKKKADQEEAATEDYELYNCYSNEGISRL